MSKPISRATVTIAGLEKTITSAVQQSDPDCQLFAGVYLEPMSNGVSSTNWKLKGIKYGQATRSKCDAALDEIVRNLQDRYVVEWSGEATNLRRILFSPSNAPKQNEAGGSPLAAALRRIRRG